MASQPSKDGDHGICFLALPREANVNYICLESEAVMDLVRRESYKACVEQQEQISFPLGRHDRLVAPCARPYRTHNSRLSQVSEHSEPSNCTFIGVMLAINICR